MGGNHHGLSTKDHLDERRDRGRSHNQRTVGGRCAGARCEPRAPSTLQTRGRRQGPAGGAFQLDLAYRRYEVAVDDPEVLVEPWVMTPRTLRLNPNADAGLLPERGNCEVYELKDITSQIRH
jgi:hypothetical protein